MKNNFNHEGDYLIDRVDTSVTAEQRDSGSIPRSGNVLFDFFSVFQIFLELCPVYGKVSSLVFPLIILVMYHN